MATSFPSVFTFALACLAAGLQTHADTPEAVDATASPVDADDPAVANYNYALGTQTFGVRYTFTDDDALVETSKAILAMGSNVLKIGVGHKYHGEWYGLPKGDGIKTMSDLVRKHPSYQEALDLPFAYYMFWAYPMAGVGGWADGFSPEEQEAEYDEMYDLCRYLLERYSGTGKTFYIGHWEGDWHLHPDFDGSKDPSDTMVQGMTDWLNVRQRAVDDAKRDTPHEGVALYHYTEVCLVDKAMNGGKTITNDILPHVNVDYVSYSSYDRLNWGGDGLKVEDIRGRLVPALDYIEAKLPAKDGLPPGKRVWIGEYGFPLRLMETPERQDRYSREVARVSLEWGCPFVLYWAMYCNENKDGAHRGFWLIDEHGVKQPTYTSHQEFLSKARAYVADYLAEHGETPPHEAYLRAAAAWLDDAP